MKKKPLRWLVKVLAALLLSVGFLFAGTGVAHADPWPPADCKPQNVPDRAGAGVPGLIDDQPQGGNGTTLYEKYGWSGMKWRNCNLGDDGWGWDSWIPDPVADTGTWLDTTIGNWLLGGATWIGAMMTQLNEWVSDPGAIMAPVDNSMVSISDAVTDSLWWPWAPVLVIIAACAIVVWAGQGDIRRAMRTVVAILIATLAVGALISPWPYSGTTTPTPAQAAGTPGAVMLGTAFDDVATGIVGDVNATIIGQNPNMSDEVAYGATLYDQILVPIWLEGQVGTDNGEWGDRMTPGQLSHDILKANTLAYGETSDQATRQTYFSDIAKELSGDEDIDDRYYYDKPWRYDQLRGTSGGRIGLGFEAFVTMFLIALIRIPASLLVLVGLLVIRFLVMFLPVWALFAIIEATRPTAKAAAKMVFAAVYNATVFGVFGAVFTAVVSAIVNDGTGFGFMKLLLILLLTIVVWVVSRPFRSVTVPATGDVLTGSGSAVKGAGSGLLGSVKAFGGMYRANRLANRGGKPQPPPAAPPPASSLVNPGPSQSDSITTTYELPTSDQVSDGVQKVRPKLQPPVADVRNPIQVRAPIEWVPAGDGTENLVPKLRKPVSLRSPLQVRSPVVFQDMNKPNSSEASAPSSLPSSYVNMTASSNNVWRPPDQRPAPSWKDREHWRQPQRIWTVEDAQATSQRVLDRRLQAARQSGSSSITYGG